MDNYKKQTQNDVTVLGENSTSETANNGFMIGTCEKYKCGQEAACKQIGNNTYRCVCPHDSSLPTKDLKCPNRITVPITPHTILNISPPGKTNSTANDTIVQPQTNESLLPDLYINKDITIIIASAGVSALILIIFVIICCLKRKQMKKCSGRNSKNIEMSYTASPIVLKKSVLVAHRYAINPQYKTCSATAVTVLQSEELHFLEEIGEGCFGKVFKGELKRESSENIEIVAIKVLKESATREAEEDFMREVEIMSAFRHQNILSLIGVVLREGTMRPMMVFEYMPHGDLTEVLRMNARYTSERTNTLSCKIPILDARALLSVALQITAGMCYLAAQRFVHRDLACRNCLVAQGPTVKIADFGMSRDVYTCDYYKIGGSRLLPVRWMSPESVMYGRFTLESDVWSFGVVLWEIYSYGKQPYYGHTNEEVVKLILQGIMLIPPEDCPSFICELMRDCWKTEPRDRIRFSEINARLLKAYENIYETEAESRVMPNRDVTNIVLPRPPPVTISDLDILDTEGYLLPQETTRTNYLQALPD